MVKLGDVLSRTGEIIEADPSREYSEITVRLWGKGVVERGRVSGGQVNGRRYVAKAGNFIASRIDARNGAMGLVPESVDGGLVTNDFPLFQPNKARLDLSYLSWLSKTAGFVELCLRASEGTTNRVRLKEDRFLALEIPLPPLSEQRRVVARIEELSAQIQEARQLRKEAAAEAETLLPRTAAKLFSTASSPSRMDEICSLITDGTHQTPRYAEDGHTFLSAQNIKPFRFMPEQHRRVSFEDYHSCVKRVKPQQGDVLMTRVGAGIGESAMIDRDIDFAFYVSLALLRPNNEIILSEYLVHWLNSPVGRSNSRRETLGKGSSQGNLNLKLLRGFELPVPPLPEQRRIVAELDALQAEVDGLKRLQAETSAELDALLPSILDRAFQGAL